MRASFLILTIIILVGSFSMGEIFLNISASKYIETSEKNYSRRQELIDAANNVISLLKSDKTPEANSFFDILWTDAGSAGKEGVTIEVNDLSAKLNINFIRPEIIENTGLSDLLKNGSTVKALSELRLKLDLPGDLYSAYGDLFDKETIEKYFTPYSYANINVTAEDVLERLYKIRTGKPTDAAYFRNNIKGYRSNFKLIAPDTLGIAIGTDISKVEPIINCANMLNVNTASEYLIEQVLSYPFGSEEIAEHQAAVSNIITLRENQEITPDRLRALIKANDHQKRVFEFLYTESWFWRITASKGALKYSFIVAKTYPDRDYVILEQDFYKE